MVNRDIVAAKLAQLSERVRRVRENCPSTVADLEADQNAMDLVAFNLMLAVQSCADVASHIISDEGWPSARSLLESFGRLGERGVIDAATAGALSKASGLRNIVAHGYAQVDAGMIHDAATRGLQDLDTFARQVSAWVMR